MKWETVPDDDCEGICAGMEAAEKSGVFEEMFNCECWSNVQSINKEEFLDQMYTGIRLYKSTFNRIYGWELSYPGFAEQAISGLEALGCKKARDYYAAVRAEIDEQYSQDMKKASAWFRGQCEKEWSELQRKAVIESRKEQEAEQLKADLQQKSDRELLILVQRLKQSGA